MSRRAAGGVDDRGAARAIAPAARQPRGGLRLALWYLVSVYCWLLLAVTSVSLYLLALVLSPLMGGERAFGTLMHWWGRITLAAAFCVFRTEGAERLASPGVLAANHQHFFDIMLLAAAVPPPFVFVARVEVLKIPIVGSVLRRGGHILVNRGAGMENEGVLEEAERRVREGKRVIFFPEGARSHDGRVRPFRSGAFRVAAASGYPLIPVALAGTRAPLPRGTPFIVPSRVRVAILEPREVSGSDARSGTFRGRVRDEVAARVERMAADVGHRI